MVTSWILILITCSLGNRAPRLEPSNFQNGAYTPWMLCNEELCGEDACVAVLGVVCSFWLYKKQDSSGCEQKEAWKKKIVVPLKFFRVEEF